MNRIKRFFKTISNSFVYLVLIVIGLALALFFNLLPAFQALTFKNIPEANIPGIFSGVLFTILIIERSVEVFISVWRDPERTRLENQKADEIKLNSYRKKTKILSFYAGFILGLLSALAGVRVLEHLIVIPEAIVIPKDLPEDLKMQVEAFRNLDILLTSLTIAGGSQVFHELISIFTDFLGQTREGIKPSEGIKAREVIKPDTANSDSN